MNKYKVFETDNFKKQIAGLDKHQAEQLYPKIKSIIYPQLRREPHYGPNIKKLKGYNPETWRYRIGSYRIFFEIDHTENVVAIIAFKSRKDTY
ncbi:MAG: type II toxin-antitoxin system RelE/ParE family toxin [Smithellaceae bacterium]